MKKLFRFTAVAAVAFTLCMALPACELIGGGEEDENEQNDGNTNDDDDDDDDDDAGNGGDAVGHAPWWDFGGVWEAFEWSVDEGVELDYYEAELMKEQTCSIQIEPNIGHRTREDWSDYNYFVEGEFNAHLLWRVVYASGPAYGSETRADDYGLEFENASGWFMLPMEEDYFEDRGDTFMVKRGKRLLVNVLYPMQDGTEGLGHVWEITFDAEDYDLATFRFDEYHIARMRRIKK